MSDSMAGADLLPMPDPARREWIVMQCLDAYRDAQGNPGQHKVPLNGYDQPMTKAEALNVLARIERERPNEDFSIRRLEWHTGSPVSAAHDN